MTKLKVAVVMGAESDLPVVKKEIGRASCRERVRLKV